MSEKRPQKKHYLRLVELGLLDGRYVHPHNYLAGRCQGGKYEVVGPATRRVRKEAMTIDGYPRYSLEQDGMVVWDGYYVHDTRPYLFGPALPQKLRPGPKLGRQPKRSPLHTAVTSEEAERIAQLLANWRNTRVTSRKVRYEPQQMKPEHE